MLTINEGNESPRLVLLVQPHLRHVEDEDGLEVLDDLQIVRGTQRHPAELVEVELRHGARAFGHGDGAAPCRELAVVLHGVRGVRSKGPEDLVDLSFVLRREWIVVDVREGAWYSSVI